ncbi:hypothetical protein A3I18_00080 [Candidatus Campbellbacteria bacterium RIFCSPLOWO2_02_FULL_35_11]|uniref:Uncharacterized protein n=2 Tax=Candidatus Campbelliibacteriota TaxID=1752727 RepID=A0A1F5EKT6_9BACT|nr:MAG: hypothetical protein A3E89_01000 [Candidatus Campbellbacteria bacterium RIFCSPHIGHO2_12_FULL_35_10]OGD70038.1 MAG: hypothetical protein A3I18_00080 [Candidatus Campbellbacteria bacterium RIFCSPLOWO2_02_FULL_35_11]
MKWLINFLDKKSPLTQERIIRYEGFIVFLSLWFFQFMGWLFFPLWIIFALLSFIPFVFATPIVKKTNQRNFFFITNILIFLFNTSLNIIFSIFNITLW